LLSPLTVLPTRDPEEPTKRCRRLPCGRARFGRAPGDDGCHHGTLQLSDEKQIGLGSKLALDAGLNTAPMDDVLSLINLAACATYLFIATGRVYGTSGAIVSPRL
jgi:hypothetical protein